MFLGELPQATPEGLRAWAAQKDIPLSEARDRAIGTIVLHCVAYDPLLSRALYFKGGNALRFIFQSPRSTIDLDVTAAEDSLQGGQEDLKQAV